MSLVFPSAQGQIVHKPRRRGATHPLFLGTTFQGSIFFNFRGGGGRVGIDGKKYSPAFIIGVKCVIIRCLVVRLPSVNCADVHLRRRYRWRFWRLRWLWAVVFIIATFYRVYYHHCCQDVEKIGPQVQIVQAWWNNWELPSKSIWHCQFIGIRVYCHNLWFRRCNRRYWNHFSGIVAWHLCGIENKRRIWSGKTLVIGWLFHIKHIRVNRTIWQIGGHFLKFLNCKTEKVFFIEAVEWKQSKSESDRYCVYWWFTFIRRDFLWCSRVAAQRRWS